MSDRGTTSWTAVAAAGTAAALGWWYYYSAQQKRNDNDDDKTRTFIELTKLENQLVSLGTAPMATLTWFQGNNKNDKAIMWFQQRVQEILVANPWLQGKLVKRSGKVHISYNNNKNDPPVVQDFLFHHTSNNNNSESSSIHHNMPPLELAKMVQKECADLGFILTMGGEYTQPFWRVALIPSSDDHFGLLVSMSHVVADGATFYTIHNMLVGATPVQSMDARRLESFEEEQETIMGKPEVGIMYSAGLIVSAIRGVFLKKVMPMILGKQRGESYHTVCRYMLVDDDKMKECKASGLATGNQDAVPFVSTNDVVTSWFLSHAACSQGLMAVNFRNRLPHLTTLHAGNYENCLYYRCPVDTNHPSLIRQSLPPRWKRVVTADQPFSNWEFARNHFSLITNWSTFHSDTTAVPACKEMLHLPIYDMTDIIPATMAGALIFRVRPGQLALLMAATPDKMERLSDCPFSSDGPIY